MPCWKHNCRRPAQRFANRSAVEAATFTRDDSSAARSKSSSVNADRGLSSHKHNTGAV